MHYKKIILVAGTRPNFVKAAPLLRAFKALPKAKRPKVLLLHTGQHYDHLMSQIFFQDLEIPRPDIFLNVKSRTPAGQVDEIIAKFQKVLAAQKPDLVMVVGDVTGTMACALAAKMSGVKVAHVEAGLRSYDQSMPEERNRVLTDHVSDLLFTSCPEARGNLLKEGIAGRKIHFAGNVMIDTLKTEIPKIKNKKYLSKLGLVKGDRIQPYVLLTLHRPGNVDDPKVLGPILKAFEKIARETTVIFPAHPRTLKMLISRGRGNEYRILKTEDGISNNTKTRSKSSIQSSVFSLPVRGLRIVPPLGYLDFIALQQNAVCVFTDSGGVQEETSFLNVPCFTVRENTERPVTVSLGTNKIIGTKPGAILEAWGKLKRQKAELTNGEMGNGNIGKPKADSLKRRASIPRWDGHAAERIVKTIVNEQ
ncbi:MAG: UDP-N-acetylglucosamine 2-epimerase (non-hydrolyzing) [bacterium]|nr:UDP-N-acetylglucosamine 2-epimerase (non-hydrolyzing) [bacterium]